jgi:hypothetical protein
MIKNIMPGKGIEVDSPPPSWPYFQISQPSAGSLRYNGSTQNFEIYDGYSWLSLPTSFATVSLSAEAQTQLEWVKNKIEEEEKVKRLAEQYSALADAKRAMDLAKEQFDILTILVQNNKV